MDPNQDPNNQQPPVGDQGGQPLTPPVQDPAQPAGGTDVPPAPESTPEPTPESPVSEPTAPQAPTGDQPGTDQQSQA